MGDLKLCPLNRMSECVREKCAWWFSSDAEPDSIDCCAIHKIAKSFSPETDWVDEYGEGIIADDDQRYEADI